MAIESVTLSSPIVSPAAVQTDGLLQTTGACPDGSIQPNVVGVCE